ncbi:acyl carrier protein [Streptomyces sp. NPDC048182]|uniref:acyl carrier protein n=1 Tax=unclassified Streptomyces TaxID=2593676 RepID=UPI0033A144BE
MADFTLNDLRTVVAACSEAADAEALEDAALDTEFADLGFDSLTVYEIVTRIQDDWEVSVPDETLDELKTPRALLDHVRGQLAAV